MGREDIDEGGHDRYAVDYSELFGDETAPDHDEIIALTDDDGLPEGFTFHAAPNISFVDNIARFQIAADEVRRLRQQGLGIFDIMAPRGLKDPGKLRRLESVLEWIMEAAENPRAAALGILPKATFMAVVCRGIYTVDMLSNQVDALSGLPAFGPNDIASINSVIAAADGAAPFRQ